MPKLDPATQARLFDTCTLTQKSKTDSLVTRMQKNWSRYVTIASALNLPPALVAVIHCRESTLDFTKHLHNGDSLNGRTYRVPAGRPRVGTPPFTFEESAEDALGMKGLKGIGDITIGEMLVILEEYNGLGYLYKGRPSPYVWSFTSHYGTNLQNSGKYIADGVFDPTEVDQQCGTAALLLRLHERDIAPLRGEAVKVKLALPEVVNTGKAGSPRGYGIRGATFVSVRDIATQMGVGITVKGSVVTVPKPTPAAVTTYKDFTMVTFNGVGYVKVAEIAPFFGLSTSYASATRTLTLSKPVLTAKPEVRQK